MPLRNGQMEERSMMRWGWAWSTHALLVAFYIWKVQSCLIFSFIGSYSHNRTNHWPVGTELTFWLGREGGRTKKSMFYICLCLCDDQLLHQYKAVWYSVWLRLGHTGISRVNHWPPGTELTFWLGGERGKIKRSMLYLFRCLFDDQLLRKSWGGGSSKSHLNSINSDIRMFLSHHPVSRELPGC